MGTLPLFLIGRFTLPVNDSVNSLLFVFPPFSKKFYMTYFCAVNENLSTTSFKTLPNFYIAIYVAAGTFMLVKGGDRWDQQPHSTGCKLCFEIILKFNKKTYFRPHPPEEENSSNHLSTLEEVVSTCLHPPLLVF